jgi:hypothetical protein
MYSREINDANPHNYRRPFMQLAFTFDFEYGGDEIFCCYTIPYSYSDMQLHLNELKLLVRDTGAQFLKFSSIGKSIGGLCVPIVKITSPSE